MEITASSVMDEKGHTATSDDLESQNKELKAYIESIRKRDVFFYKWFGRSLGASHQEAPVYDQVY